MSNGGVPQSPEELRQHFNEQIEFLRRSADAFDAGFEAEAKRLAVSLRVLMHDTSVSHSLLAQVGLKDRNFLSTAIPHREENLLSHFGLLVQVAGPDGSRYRAPLDDSVTHRWLGFDDWWGEPVFEDVDGNTLTRGELVRNVANKDGGAHVDPELTEVYANLSRNNSLGWTWNTGDSDGEPIPHPERAAIRQIAHEVLRTLVRGYSKTPPERPAGSAMIAGPVFVDGTDVPKPPEPETVGRNEPCPCGSGEKFKRCHGRPY